MIEISLNAALIFYSSLIGIGAFLFWLYTEVSVQRHYQVLEKQHLWRCAYCAFTYLDEDAELYSKCPRCDSMNSIADHKTKFIPVPKQKLQSATPWHQNAVAETEEGDLPRRNPSRRKRPQTRRRGPRRRR